MYLIYSLLFTLAFVILLPRFLLDAFRHGKYVAGFRERLGNVSPLRNDKPLIWIHCVSVGETQAARPLVKSLRQRFPDHSIAVSTTTRTGQELAHQVFGNEVERVFYFPFDWRFAVRKTIRSINPAAVVIMETELWPAFLRECERKQIPVAIVNGRLSEKSFKRYRLVTPFMSRVLKPITMALMQTQADAERLTALGINSSRVRVCGNLKFDVASQSETSTVAEEFRQRFNVRDDAPIVLAASTHAPEEWITLQAFARLIESEPTARLVIAPRHPERFAEVASLIESANLRWTRRSRPASENDQLAQVILLDTIGELPLLYSLATLVFVGGSIARSGGHNILEPASAGACVITGPYTHNFRQIVKEFVEGDAAVQLPELSESESATRLAQLLSNLMSDRTRRKQIGERGRALLEQNRGATKRVLELLATMLQSEASTSVSDANAREMTKQ